MKIIHNVFSDENNHRIIKKLLLLIVLSLLPLSVIAQSYNVGSSNNTYEYIQPRVDNTYENLQRRMEQQRLFELEQQQRDLQHRLDQMESERLFRELEDLGTRNPQASDNLIMPACVTRYGC